MTANDTKLPIEPALKEEIELFFSENGIECASQYVGAEVFGHKLRQAFFRNVSRFEETKTSTSDKTEV